MRLLLDSHFVVWLTTRPDNLTASETGLLEREDVDIAASAVSLWELRLKWNRHYASGTRKGPGEPGDMKAALDAMDIDIIPLHADEASSSLLVPMSHKDPFDEQLLIQAQQTGRRLLTRDALLLNHPLAISAP